MSTEHEPAPPVASTVLPFGRLAVWLVSGAVAGVVVGFFSTFVVITLGWWHSGRVARLLDWHSDRVWLYVELDRILGAAISGAIGGFFTSLFFRRIQHPILLAVLWGSILGTIGLVVFAVLTMMTQPPQPIADGLLQLGYFLATGAIFGFVTGMAARLLVIGLERVQRRG